MTMRAKQLRDIEPGEVIVTFLGEFRVRRKVWSTLFGLCLYGRERPVGSESSSGDKDVSYECLKPEQVYSVRDALCDE
jgi:hypothetical protein